MNCIEYQYATRYFPCLNLVRHQVVPPLVRLSNHRLFCPTPGNVFSSHVMLSHFEICCPTSGHVTPPQVVLSHFELCYPTSVYVVSPRVMLPRRPVMVSYLLLCCPIDSILQVMLFQWLFNFQKHLTTIRLLQNTFQQQSRRSYMLPLRKWSWYTHSGTVKNHKRIESYQACLAATLCILLFYFKESISRGF